MADWPKYSGCALLKWRHRCGMRFKTSWSPRGLTMFTESSSDRLHDGISLMSLTLFMGIGYGTVLTIYIQCLFSLAHSPMRQAPRLFFLSYTSVIFILETLYVAANSR